MRTQAGAAAVLAALLAVCCSTPPSEQGRVVVGVPAGLLRLAPHAESEEFALSILGNAYERLFVRGPEGDLQPALAESWATPDDRTWVFRLRAGVRLHDGRLLEAAQVADSIRVYLEDRESAFGGARSIVASVEARDPRHVVVRTRQTVSFLQQVAGAPVFLASTTGASPVGTGPYRIARWSPGGSVTLEAFPDHWRGRPSVTTLEFQVEPSGEQRVERLQSGALDLILDVPAAAFKALGSTPGVRTVVRPGLRVVYLGLNCAREPPPGARWRTNPLRDRRVRRAVAGAIDRLALVGGPLGGHAEVLDQLVTPGVLGFAEGVPAIPFDPGASRRLLAEAGYAKGFALEIEFPAEKYRAVAEVAEAVAAGLRAVGIDARAIPLPWSEFNQRDLRHSLAWLLGWMSTSDAGMSYDLLVHSPMQGLGTDNAMGYASREVDVALDAARGELKAGQRRDLLRSVAQRLREDLPAVPLYRQADLYAMKEDLDFTPRLDRGVEGRDMRWRSRR